MLPQDVLPNLALLGKDVLNDFDPFIEGSFVYWGADSLYSIPSAYRWTGPRRLVGLDSKRIRLLPNNGAEPIGGYTDGPAQLLPNLETGFQYLVDGLIKYVAWTPTAVASAADASTAAAAAAARTPARCSDRWATTPDC